MATASMEDDNRPGTSSAATANNGDEGDENVQNPLVENENQEEENRPRTPTPPRPTMAAMELDVNEARKKKEELKQNRIFMGFCILSVLALILSFIANGLAISAFSTVKNLGPVSQAATTESSTVVYPNYKPRSEFEKHLKAYFKNNGGFYNNTKFDLTRALANPVEEVEQLHRDVSFAYTWRIGNVSTILQDKALHVAEESFYIKSYGIKGHARFGKTDKGRIHLMYNFIFPDDQLPHWTALPKAVFVMRDMNPGEDVDRSIVLAKIPDFDNNPRYVYIFFAGSTFALNNPRYVVNDTLTMDFYVEPQFVVEQVFSYVGFLMWEVKDYKEDNKFITGYRIRPQSSPYFYTSYTGFRMKADVGVKLYTDGEDRIKSMSVQVTLVFLTGHNDFDLYYDFYHTTTVTIFNQKDPNRNIVHSVDEDFLDLDSYTIELATHHELDDYDGYFVNDALLYKIVVEERGSGKTKPH